jgi:2-dehydropantoate 2-reductase
MMQDLDKYKITIVGAGAIGGLAGAYLSQAGYEVTLTDNWKEHIGAMQTGGLYVDGTRGPKHFDVKACLTTELSAPLGMIFLGVKSQHTSEAMESLRHLLTPETVVVSLQNGFNYETLQSFVKPAQIVGSVPNYGSALVDPGHIEHVYEGPLHIGELSGALSERIYWLEEAFESFTETYVTTNIVGEIWGKLCSFSEVTLTALANASMHAVLSTEKYGRLSLILIAEALKVADAAGITIPSNASFDPRPYRLQKPADTQRALEHLNNYAEFLSHEHGQDPHQYVKVGSGVWWDIVYRHRISETRAGLTGALVEKARQLGVAVPLNGRLVEMIYQIERGERPLSWKNLEELDAFRQASGLELP